MNVLLHYCEDKTPKLKLSTFTTSKILQQYQFINRKLRLG
jgi:hypothetical protein